MPTLSLAESGGRHYIVKEKSAWSGKNKTWQIKPEGIEFLRVHFVTIPLSGGEKAEFSSPFLQELIKKQWVDIKGEGRRDDEHEEALLLSPKSQNHLQLALIEQESDIWQLSIFIPTLPDEWLQTRHQESRRDYAFAIHCDFEKKSSRIVRFLDIDMQNCIVCEVVPQTNTYHIEARGSWPPSWNVQNWVHDVPGLSSQGTLFAGPEKCGIRLRRNEPTYPGRVYYFVALSPITLLGELSAQFLGSMQKWSVWKIQIPEEMNACTHQIISTWCREIGHPFHEPPWKLALQSPPALYYTKNDIPCLQQRQVAVIEVSIPINRMPDINVCKKDIGALELFIECDKTHQVNSISLHDHGYVTFPLENRGEYSIKGKGDSSNAIRFKVIGLPLLQTSSPEPLKVVMKTGTQTFTCSAFDKLSDSGGKRILSLDQFRPEIIPECVITCPVLVDMTWSYDTEHSRELRQVEASYAANTLAEDLSRLLTCKEKFELFIDAGTFGFLDLRFEAARKACQGEHVEMSPALLQRMRWLHSVLPILAQEEVTVPIPHGVRISLAKLSRYSDGAVLARMTHIPQVFLPHVCALARTIEQSLN